MIITFSFCSMISLNSYASLRYAVTKTGYIQIYFIPSKASLLSFDEALDNQSNDIAGWNQTAIHVTRGWKIFHM